MSHMANQTLAERLSQSRTNVGLSQQALAKVSGVSQQTISSLESGKIQSSKGLLALAEACKVDITWLVSGKGEGLTLDAHVEHRRPQGLIANAQEVIRGVVQADILVKVAHDQLQAALAVLEKTNHPLIPQIGEALFIVRMASATLSADAGRSS